VGLTRRREALEEVLSSRFTAADLKALQYSVHMVVVDSTGGESEGVLSGSLPTEQLAQCLYDSGLY
jgi:hypothetical protein